MTTIRAKSVCHGVVDIAEKDVAVIIPDHAANSPFYMFRCPVCSMVNENRADNQIVALLVSAGVVVLDVAKSVAALDDDAEIERVITIWKRP